MRFFTLSFLALSMLMSCYEKTTTAIVQLEPKSNSEVRGEAVFTEKNGKVMMKLKVEGLTPNGKHAIHLHERADCSADDATSTGGHWNPLRQAHGEWGSENGFHRGDIGNLIADENGKAELIFETDLWCLDCNDETKNIVNLAVIIHQDPDDFSSQPTGNAGKRISCGGIISIQK